MAACSARISILKQELGGRTNKDRLTSVLRELLDSDPSLASDALYTTLSNLLNINSAAPTAPESADPIIPVPPPTEEVVTVETAAVDSLTNDVADPAVSIPST